MSKAFTKEDTDSADDLEGGAEAEDQSIPKGTKNYITPAGFGRMKEELHRLLNVDRPELVKVIAWAASNGDRSENGDYIYGKRKLREIDRRIRFLTKRLDAAEVVDPAAQSADRVLFGATVTVVDEDGKSKRYTIVGVDEIDAGRGRVSWLSPMARALLNAKVGDAVTLATPRGEQELEIAKIEYKAID